MLQGRSRKSAPRFLEESSEIGLQDIIKLSSMARLLDAVLELHTALEGQGASAELLKPTGHGQNSRRRRPGTWPGLPTARSGPLAPLPPGVAVAQ